MIKQREIHVEWTDVPLLGNERETIEMMAAQAERTNSFTTWARGWPNGWSSLVDVDEDGRVTRRGWDSAGNYGPVLAYLVEVTDDQETLS